MKRSGLRDRMGRLFAIQLTVIGLATLIGIYLTQVIVEDLLTRQALNLEAEHYWTLQAENPLQPLPNVANMRGYLGVVGSTDGVPRELVDLPPGFRRATVGGRSLLTHVSDNGANRLYLVFEGDRVSDLAFYFGILPLSFVLALMYLTLFIAHRLSQRALSPLVGLARQLEEVDFLQQGHIELNLEPLLHDADAEVAAMVRALQHFTSRLDAAIERERVFTRDAGHELRTPVAVFKGTLDLLEKDTRRSRQDLQALARMRKTVTDMESLLETLLLLARGDELVTQTGGDGGQ